MLLYAGGVRLYAVGLCLYVDGAELYAARRAAHAFCLDLK